MPTKVAVVIPVYKEKINDLEKISLAQVRKVLGKYPIIFVAPEGKRFSYFEPGDMVVHFPEKFFQSRQSYSWLMMSPDFYAAFLDFDYILIYQLDAFVFYDALEFFCGLGYDYIGAPWAIYAWRGFRKPRTPRVGNGGFSLRNVKTHYEFLTECSALPNWETFLEYTEDAFFAFCGIKEGIRFRTAPVAIADAFSMEHLPTRFMKKFKNLLPFGCHNWHQFSADFYVELFAQFGYDLRPFRDQMDSKDITTYTPNYLADLAMERLVRRAERGLPIAKGLAGKRFASVRVLRTPNVMKILARLLWEENSLSDKIILYEEKDWRSLVRDVSPEPLPHLLLTLDDDAQLISLIEDRGLRYGEQIVSFQREYLNYCERIFHGLGK